MRRRSLVIFLVVAVAVLTAVVLPQHNSSAAGTDHFIITGAGQFGGPHVRVFTGDGSPTPSGFFAYDPGFTGGVRVAAGDLNLDGSDEIVTGAGPGGGPHVRAFTLGGTPTSLSFFPYDPDFTGGVFVAAGGVTLDQERIPFIVTGAGSGGGPHVKVWQVNPDTLEVNEALSFFPYSPSFTGGVQVAAADVNGDGNDEIITGAGPSGGPHVRVFEIQPDGTLAELGGWNAYGATFPGGVFVAGASHAKEVVTGPGAGGGPDVRTFDPEGKNTLASFQAYGGGFPGGVRVAAGDLDDDGNDEIVTGAGPGGGPHVRAFNDNGSVTSVSFMAYNIAFTGGVYVAVGKAPAPPPTTTTSTTASSTTSTTSGSTTTSTTSASTTTSTTSASTTTSTTSASTTTSTTACVPGPPPLCT